MNYCSQCGARVQQRIPAGDNRQRYVCDACDTIHYQNPKVIAGCIPEWQDKILLCRRAIEPRYGLWTLPAGFMENDETMQQAAARETREEANTNVEIHSLYVLFNLPHINQIYVMFRSHLLDCDYGPSSESLEVELFEERNIPWDRIAFPVIEETLRRYFKDRNIGKFNTYIGDIIRLPSEPPGKSYRFQVTYLNPTQGLLKK